MRSTAVLFTILLLTGGEIATAQSVAGAPDDSLFRRARRMVADGQGTAGRALVDSLLRLSPEGSARFGDALYWRGALAETAAEAERDYRRVIVEYPLSPYSDDALLAIAELEQARGDRAGALLHLQRFVREHPVSRSRGKAALAAARLAFDLRDTRTACAMLSEARASATDGDIELKNQLEYFAGRCPREPLPATATPAPSVGAPSRVRDTTTITPPTVVPVREAPTITTARPARRDSTRVPATTAPAVRAGNHTIQLAAYNTRAAAQRLVARLAARQVTARISGVSKPFRVRLGYYASRQDALDAVAELKAKGITGFVTTEATGSARMAP